mmetsp:Transcript_26088/g.71856  ORF Transcript_26088/g.71856 Transcript_26088/m.71856 type:complete len:709 (+) Transcript_26088:150-2276(+)|eukprot:CAMPEP_0168719136 /NCGR_PEP_ID=MMETSP0724-20121128/881_1 /TAXON_ID=265536 /ORGANISM="Amphiprora sp., Strain CCMP467" /LENGTH=708 /DNA_ID=CAMNT_0008765677 /DNA_START=93 /DNA_END=2219 /DNA_ORIENTATION=+
MSLAAVRRGLSSSTRMQVMPSLSLLLSGSRITQQTSTKPNHLRLLHPINRFFSTNSIQGPHGSYQEEYDKSMRDPVAFWKRAAQNLHWFQEPTQILNQDNPQQPDWFSDGFINMSYNCLDVHVQNGRGDQVALIYDSPLTGGVQQQFTYRQLLEQVAMLAAALQDEFHVQTGDRVVIYCPPTPEAVVSMLACTRIGAIHSVVFGGFAAPELAKRLQDCQPKVVITASCGVEPKRVVPYMPLVERALEIASQTNKDPPQVTAPRCIVINRDHVPNAPTVELNSTRGDVDYHKLLSQTNRQSDAVPLPASHPNYVLYTSGTTGRPKGVVRDTGGHAVALKYSMSAFYNVNPGEVFWAGSDIGWVVGHSYIVYGPLLQGCTTILYEGKPVGTPNAGAFWRVCQDYQVKALFAAPTAFRAMKQADPHGEFVRKYDLSKLQTLFLAGEHSDPDTLHWCERALQDYNIPALDHWWQTELGWPGVGNAVGLGRFPTKYGACAAAVPGFGLDVLDDGGHKLPTGKLGNMVLKLPLPPGTLTTLYQNEERFVQSYLTHYPGHYDTGDAAYRDEDGYVFIMGRTDDIINTAGHRLSTGGMEEILMEHEDVADCAVIGVKDELKGQVPVGFATLVADSDKNHETIKADLVQLVRDTLGPVAAFKKVAIVKALPKTRSGKILRGTMAKIANGEEYSITPTIEDATIFDYLGPIITELVQK